jgi:hypothetical protein
MPFFVVSLSLGMPQVHLLGQSDKGYQCSSFVDGCHRMYSTKFFPFQIPYLTVILVEPKLIHLDTFYKTIKERGDFDGRFTETATTRRSSWSSKEDAFKYLGGRFPWNAWDTRILRVHAVRPQRQSRET